MPGYLMKKVGCEPGPLVLAFVLGGFLEPAFRRAMRTFEGDLTGVLTQPIATTLLGAIVVLALAPTAVQVLTRRRKAAPSPEKNPALVLGGPPGRDEQGGRPAIDLCRMDGIGHRPAVHPAPYRLLASFAACPCRTCPTRRTHGWRSIRPSPPRTGGPFASTRTC
ncbi:hypothetical protein Acsp04_51780 [Actinomadura sp. NBRC 104425]|uniref:hypothetical protein n=1 Tax=Actinomadura sp. NBRC 104425 TaxID=3032204 RepID=UPI0024A57F9B|nr:hypothetical protein [Actinomadura sp. NBRC 104425]GLZ14943.1 hypothetical protein Acsp04_51780 [Actinomadura sp. NBRC 104425]